MVITKVTLGFVAQRYDTETGRWLDQEFVAGDQVDWEDENGEAIDINEMEGEEPYLPFEMKHVETDMSMEEKVRFDTLLEAFAERVTDDADMDGVIEMSQCHIINSNSNMSLEELEEHVGEFYPELLEE